MGRRAVWAQRPCLREFWEEICLPLGVRGPVDFLEFFWLAASRVGEIFRRWVGALAAAGKLRLKRDLDLALTDADVDWSISAMLILPPLVVVGRAPPYEQFNRNGSLDGVRWRRENVRRKMENILG